ncbi:MAG: DnaD domain protein [Bacilli bacterium]|nr:DnaD domain protein [Bacilli bacterium]
MENVEANYQIKSRTILSSEYSEFLYKLYLPLIGYEATFLYEFLLNEYKTGNTYFSLQDFIELTNMKVSQFTDTRRVLEAYGLIQSFKKDNDYILILNGILTPKNFFKDDVLKGLLIKKIGEEKVKELLAYYEIEVNTNGYKEISASLSEVTDVSFDVNSLRIGEDTALISTNKIERSSRFNEDLFFKCLARLMNNSVSPECFSEKELIIIKSKAELYGLNENVLADLVRQCYEVNNMVGDRVNAEKLDKACVFEIVSKKNYNIRRPSKVNINGDTDFAKLIRYYENISPRELLKEKQNGHEPVQADLAIINYLSESFGFDAPIINALIDYTLQHCDNTLSRSYIEKVASSLIRKNVVTILDVVNTLYKRSPSSVKKVEKVNIKNEKVKTEDDDDEDYIDDLEDII